eukprot:TRINITY_DN13531_c0_g3_i1.p1 TRINITY_DN13531_c0_g3~~TRINITY_DN13531_c0_g3_i1.p1  ORF type:complete len:550 (+),score=94.77 TRINITY_DN13531_c0_g3_i1:140-1789(+)
MSGEIIMAPNGAAKAWGGRVLWIRSEAFDHGVFNTSVRWTVPKVLDFMGFLRVAVPGMSLSKSTWIEVATSRCKPALTEAEGSAYWHIFTVLQQTIAGQTGEWIDIRLVGLILMCQVFSPHRVRTDHMAKAAEMWPSQERAPHSLSSPRHSPRGSSPRVAVSASTAVSRGRDSSAALLTFARQHFGNFLQIACFALTTEPATVSADEFDVLGLILRGGHNCRTPLKRLSEAVPELCTKKSMPMKDLRKYVEKTLVWNDEIYPSGDTCSHSPSQPFDVAVGRTLNISGMSKTTWFQRPQSGEVDFLNITSCTDCIIYITFQVRLCLIAGCHECTIVMGPVSALCTVQNCEKISTHCAAHSFKMENCIDSCAFLYCKIPPILTGDTRGIKLAPYNVLYSTIGELLQVGGMTPEVEFVDIWAHPVCCTLGQVDETLGARSGSFDDSSNSTYHFVHPKSFQPVVIPEVNGRTAIQRPVLCLPQVYDDAFQSRVEEMQDFHQQLASINDEGKRKRAQQAIQGHFREWLQTTGKSRQLADLARMAQAGQLPCDPN